MVNRIWFAGAILIATGCNSFAALDGVVESQTDSAIRDIGTDLGTSDLGLADSGLTDSGADAETSDLGPDLPKVYSPIDSEFLFATKQECEPPIGNVFPYVSVLDATRTSALRPVGFSIALDSNGDGYIRWRQSSTVLGAKVSMAIDRASYSPNFGGWHDFVDPAIDTTLIQSHDDSFVVGTLTKCNAGKYLHIETGSAASVATEILENDVFNCPQSPDFGLGSVGGFNPFDPQNRHRKLRMTSFREKQLRSRNQGEMAITQNQIVSLNDSEIPYYGEPFVESTSGALLGFGSDDVGFFLWDAEGNSEVFETPYPGIRGKIALVHLVSDHYVLAVVSGKQISLYRFEYQSPDSLQDKSEIVWVDEAPTMISSQEDVQFMELAVMPGGFTVFYDDGMKQVLQPVVVVPNPVMGRAEELRISETKIEQAITSFRSYIDMDFTIRATNCDLVFAKVVGYLDSSGTKFINFEGGRIPGFYRQ